MKRASNARNFSQCDSLLMGDQCGAHTFPYIDVENQTARIEHEATTSKIGEDQIFYCLQRGIDEEAAVALIVNGYAKEVLNQLPMEFAVEAQKLLALDTVHKNLHVNLLKTISNRTLPPNIIQYKIFFDYTPLICTQYNLYLLSYLLYLHMNAFAKHRQQILFFKFKYKQFSLKIKACSLF